MTSPKERRKARRRAEALMDEAYEAVQSEQLARAVKLSQRAIDIGSVNPRLWLDHGAIHHLAGDGEVAESAFRQAIALAPTYAEAFEALARLQAERGKLDAAVRLLGRAVELAPDNDAAREQLASLRAVVGPEPSSAGTEQPPPAFTCRTERFDWDAVDAELRAVGVARLPGLLSDEECAALVALWEVECFEHEVRGEHTEFGQMTYRFFNRPLPPLVAELREEIYARLAPRANAVQAEFHRSERFPNHLADFLDRCHAAGQHRTTPILLRYPVGGSNAPHRDIAGRVVFPYQLAVTLGPGCSARGEGGALRLLDDRPGKKVHEKRVDTDVGDGVLFCARERLVQVAGVSGMQPVMHAVTECSKERFALGVPFHEHG